jgi:glycosyltransferase involved in cell wall biosynthesis
MLRRWDVRAAAGVTQFVANSEITRQRIGEFYDRDSIVVHPPVAIDRFTREPDPQDYFLTVGEVTRHKNTELALAAADRAGVTIKVAGEGPDRARLRARYPRAEFLGRVGDRRLAELYAGCRALVVPAVEEFGITMVEALAAGRPVLAAAAGGALEILTDDETGILVKARTVDVLAEALRETDWESFEIARLRADAERFSEKRFRERFAAVVSATIQSRQSASHSPTTERVAGARAGNRDVNLAA